MFTTKSQKETFSLGKKIAGSFSGGEVLALFGELGAGKTSFAKGVINYFLPRKRVISPTFIIVRHYHPNSNAINHLVHADLYRLNNEQEIDGLGLTEFMNNESTVVLIEWADKMPHLLPANRQDIFFEIVSDTVRKIKIVSP